MAVWYMSPTVAAKTQWVSHRHTVWHNFLMSSYTFRLPYYHGPLSYTAKRRFESKEYSSVLMGYTTLKAEFLRQNSEKSMVNRGSNWPLRFFSTAFPIIRYHFDTTGSLNFCQESGSCLVAFTHCTWLKTLLVDKIPSDRRAFQIWCVESQDMCQWPMA